MKKLLISSLLLLSCAGWLSAGPAGPPAGVPILNSSKPQIGAVFNVSSGNATNFYSSTITVRKGIEFNDGSFQDSAFPGSLIYPASGTPFFQYGFSSSTGTFSATVQMSSNVFISGLLVGTTLYYTSATITNLTIGTTDGVIGSYNGVLVGGRTTSDLPEGNRYYFTTARATSAISGDLPILNIDGLISIDKSSATLLGPSPTTSNIPEGSNFYFTEVRATSSISGLDPISNLSGVITLLYVPGGSTSYVQIGNTPQSGSFCVSSGTVLDLYSSTITANVFFGDGSNLSGILAEMVPGSTNYIHNTSERQPDSNFYTEEGNIESEFNIHSNLNNRMSVGDAGDVRFIGFDNFIINTKDSEAFKVESDGINDDVFVVDTSSPFVTINSSVTVRGDITADQYYGDGSNLTNIVGMAPGATYYLWNTDTLQQATFYVLSGTATNLNSTNIYTSKLTGITSGVKYKLGDVGYGSGYFYNDAETVTVGLNSAGSGIYATNGNFLGDIGRATSAGLFSDAGSGNQVNLAASNYALNVTGGSNFTGYQTISGSVTVNNDLIVNATGYFRGLNINAVEIWVSSTSTIQSVINSITDASAAKPYLVRIPPGVYTEQITMKDYVSLKGAGMYATKITYAGTTLFHADQVNISDLTLEGTGSGVAINNVGKATCANDIFQVNDVYLSGTFDLYKSAQTGVTAYFYNVVGLTNYDGFVFLAGGTSNKLYVFNSRITLTNTANDTYGIFRDASTSGSEMYIYNSRVDGTASSNLNHKIFVSNNLMRIFNTYVDVVLSGTQTLYGVNANTAASDIKVYGGSIKVTSSGAGTATDLVQSLGTLNVYGTAYSTSSGTIGGYGDDDGVFNTRGNLMIGSGVAATDYAQTFDGETNDGTYTWMEDEDYFLFADDIYMNVGENITIGNGATGALGIGGAANSGLSERVYVKDNGLTASNQFVVEHHTDDANPFVYGAFNDTYSTTVPGIAYYISNAGVGNLGSMANLNLQLFTNGFTNPRAIFGSAGQLIGSSPDTFTARHPFSAVTNTSTDTVMAIRRTNATSGLSTAYGLPYLAIGADEYTLNMYETIGFGWTNGTTYTIQPAEIGFQMTSTSGGTKGDLVFAARTLTTNSAPTEKFRIKEDGSYTFTGNVDTDIITNWIGTTKSGIWTWLEDEGAFQITSAQLNTSFNNLTITDTTALAAGIGGGIAFQGIYTGASVTSAAGIKMSKTNATDGDYSFDLDLYARLNGGAIGKRLTVKGTGELLVTSPANTVVGAYTGLTINQLYNPASNDAANTTGGASLKATVAGANNAFNITGALVWARYAGTGRPTGTLSGFDSLAQIASGAAAGTLAVLRSGNYVIDNSDADTIVTRASGLEINTPTNAGTFTNTYGLYILSQGAGTQTNIPYGIYQAGTGDDNYFAGDVKLPDNTRLLLGSSLTGDCSFYFDTNDLYFDISGASAATAGASPFAILKLQDALGASHFEIQNNAGSAVFEADSLGNVIIGAALTTTLQTIYPPSAAQSITGVGSTILANATIIVLNPDGNYTLTSAPTIANGFTGQIVYITSGNAEANIVTIQDQDTLANSNLQFGATTRALGARDVLTLIFDGTDWIEVSYANN
jgi:hypothetical protein